MLVRVSNTPLPLEKKTLYEWNAHIQMAMRLKKSGDKETDDINLSNKTKQLLTYFI